MSALDYKTIRVAANDEFTVKRSRFIGHISPVSTAKEAEEFIEAVSKKHRDATHNVFAYVLREGSLSRYSDDGEPQGTAGIPVLDVIRKQAIVDCAVVVTRYFGGVMLGAGGLVRAYSHAASLAVDAGGVIKKALCARLCVSCDYYFFGKLSSLVPAEGGVIEGTDFADNVTLTFLLPCELVDAFNAKLIDLSNGRYSATKTDELFFDIG